MNFPAAGDYIDIHNHGAKPAPGVFTVETLLAHEERDPDSVPGLTYTIGIHPWHLNEENHDLLLSRMITFAGNRDISAIGEAGYDRIRGASRDLQRRTFEEQVLIAEEHRKPMVIHCVRGWDDLLMDHKRLKPRMPWLIHGFRGKPVLASQLVARGMFISFWFEFILRPEATSLVKSIPLERIFLETDGADVDIKDIYKKVSADLGIQPEALKTKIYSNFMEFFKFPLCAT